MANELDIEKSLQRLMPRGLGEEVREDLEAIIDDLAGEAQTTSRMPGVVWWSLAATIAIFVFSLGLVLKGGLHWKQGALVSLEEPAFELIEQSVWLEQEQDEGLRAMNEAGDAMRALSYQAVEEERVRDLQSGYVVTLQREFDGEVYLATSL